MNAYGQNQVAAIGAGQRTLAVPHTARWKPGGMTIDWEEIVAVTGDDVTLDDGTVISIGDKYVRYGTSMSRITATDLFAPTDSGGSGGVETVTNAVRGNAYILDETVLYSTNQGRPVGGFDGGVVFRDHLNLGYSGAPTEANIETMYPGVTFLNDLA